MSLVDVGVIYIGCSYGMMVAAFTSTPFSVPNRKTFCLSRYDTLLKIDVSRKPKHFTIWNGGGN